MAKTLEQLKFKEQIIGDCIMYIRGEVGSLDRETICFYKPDKTYHMLTLIKNSKDGKYDGDIAEHTSYGVEIHMAITLKLKELGWIDET